ncbi:carbohydrate kinase family protein [Cryobacterium sp. Hh7]|uniref:carbohydrate kinase family protein n=1 Tax=Cryobacterium sp. Hh7 TaxID=1259159 RepID=UPI00141B2077|nr:carbohydrate kinase family protein [Cryobacterium sp. Hh7]
MYKISVAGHICADLTPELPAGIGMVPGQLVNVGRLKIRPGGCVVNTGGDLAALGISVSTSGIIGDDELGRIVLASLVEQGITTTDLQVERDYSTSYSIVLEPPGMNRSFWHHVGASIRFDGTRVSVEGIDLLHLGYPPLLPSLLPSTAQPIVDLFNRARDSGATTSLDMAVVDGDSPVGRVDWHGIFKRVLPLVDIFTPSLDDLQSALALPVVTDRSALSELAQSLIDDGVAIVMISTGEDGVLLRTGTSARFASGGRVLASLGADWHDAEFWVPAVHVERIMTTNGAGDAASAGMLFGLVSGYSPREAAELAVLVASAKIRGESVADLAIPLPHETFAS